MSNIIKKGSFHMRSWSIFGIRVSLVKESWWNAPQLREIGARPWGSSFSIQFRPTIGGK